MHEDVSVGVVGETVVAVTTPTGSDTPVDAQAYGFALGTGTQTFRQALSATGQVAVVDGNNDGDPVVVSFADGRSDSQAGRPTGPPQPELVTLDVASGGAPKRAKLDREDFSTSMWDFEFLLAWPHLVGAAKEAVSDPDPGTESPEDAELVAYRVG